MSLLNRYSNVVKERGKKTKVALVGAGQMGQGIVTQINKMEDTDLVLIVDKNQDKLDMARSKYDTDKDITISSHLDSLDDQDLDVVIEATGTPSSGADVAFKVLNRNINLILLNVETEATIGLALNKEAEKNNIVSKWIKGNKVFYYSGCQIISKNVFNKKMKNFSINKIWDKLIIQQNLQGNLSNSDILHIGDKNSLDEL